MPCQTAPNLGEFIGGRPGQGEYSKNKKPRPAATGHVQIKITMKNTTMADAVKAFQAGEKVILCEARFSKCETINYRDKKTGQAASFTQIRHTVEIGEAAFLVSERPPEGFKPETFKPEILKGTKCLLRFDRFMVDKGVGQFSGTPYYQ